MATFLRFVLNKGKRNAKMNITNRRFHNNFQDNTHIKSSKYGCQKKFISNYDRFVAMFKPEGVTTFSLKLILVRYYFIFYIDGVTDLVIGLGGWWVFLFTTLIE